jgi:tetratricopeptide (TPR) repeat protein
MLARRGDFSAARELLAVLHDRDIYLPRELEVQSTLIAEQGTWDEAERVIQRARRLGADGKLLALPLHADRLEGRSLLAVGDAAAAVDPLERALAGFADLDARWEVALTALSLGEALVELERNEQAARVLERAADEFVRLRIPRELERAQRLLASLNA